MRHADLGGLGVDAAVDLQLAAGLLRVDIGDGSACSFGIRSAVYNRPPKPGSTVMTSTRPQWSRNGSTASAGVFGLDGDGGPRDAAGLE